jgi:hypothetical protein
MNFCPSSCKDVSLQGQTQTFATCHCRFYGIQQSIFLGSTLTLTYYLEVYMAYIYILRDYLTFFLAYTLTFCLTVFLIYFLESILTFFLPFYLASILTFLL